MRHKRAKKGFTLIEILVTVAILSVLVTLCRVSYLAMVVRARAAGCRNNLRIIKHALDNYASEYDDFPSSLSQLKPRHLNKAVAEVLIDKGDILSHLGFFLIQIKEGGNVFASSTLGLAPDVRRCPGTGNLYAIWKGLKYTNEYKKLAIDKPDTLIVVDFSKPFSGDMEQPGFTDKSEVDLISHGKFGQGITITGCIKKFFYDGHCEQIEDSSSRKETTSSKIEIKENKEQTTNVQQRTNDNRQPIISDETKRNNRSKEGDMNKPSSAPLHNQNKTPVGKKGEGWWFRVWHWWQR
ncbi:MAG: type II secretion system protein [bacterium]